MAQGTCGNYISNLLCMSLYVVTYVGDNPVQWLDRWQIFM